MLALILKHLNKKLALPRYRESNETYNLQRAAHGGHSSAGRTGAGRGAEAGQRAASGGSGRCAGPEGAVGTAAGRSDTPVAVAPLVAGDVVASDADAAAAAGGGDALGRGRCGPQPRFSGGRARLLGRVSLSIRATQTSKPFQLLAKNMATKRVPVSNRGADSNLFKDFYVQGSEFKASRRLNIRTL